MTHAIRLKHMPRRREAAFYLLTSDQPDSQTGVLAFGKVDGEKHLEIANRNTKTNPLTQSKKIFFGLIPVLPMTGEDFSYSPEGGDFELDCSQTPNLPETGEPQTPEPASGMFETIRNVESSCLFVKTESQSYLFILPLDGDEDFITKFLRERLDGKVLLSVLSAGSLRVKTPLTSNVSRILTD